MTTIKCPKCNAINSPDYTYCILCLTARPEDEPMRGLQGGHDPVNHPKHYTKHPSGVECIQVTEHMNFCRGNAIKYIWRAGAKGDELEDLRKAKWYLEREIERLAKK